MQWSNVYITDIFLHFFRKVLSLCKIVIKEYPLTTGFAPKKSNARTNSATLECMQPAKIQIRLCR